MAVIDTVQGLKVEVFVDGQPALEYDNDGEETVAQFGASVTKYIEAKTGATFELRVTIEPGFPHRLHDLDFNTKVDGRDMHGKVISKEKFWAGHRFTISGARYSQNNQWFTRQFTFSGLNIVEDHPSVVDDTTLKQLQKTGMISVRVWRVNKVGYKATTRDRMQATEQPSEISEKVLKGRALTHSTDLGTQKSIPRCNIAKLDWVDSRKKPLLTYNFKYRSYDALKALLIIPRRPSPVPPEPMHRENMTREQLLELSKRQEEELEGLRLQQIKPEVKPEVKRERMDDDDDDDGILEVRPVKSRRTSGGAIETIDLTDD